MPIWTSKENNIRQRSQLEQRYGDRGVHPIQDKASQFGTLPTQDEWCGRSGQQKCKEDYSQGYRDIQRLAREAAFCITCLSNWGLNID